MASNLKKLKRKIKRKSLSFKNFNNNFSLKFKHFSLMHWTYPKKIFLGIILIWFIGAILLYTPWAFNYESYQYINNEYIFQLKSTSTDTYMNLESTLKNYHYNFLSAIFTAASAFTDTGLTVISSVGTDLSFFGQFVVFVLIEVGGFGYASLFYLLGKSIQKLTKKNLFTSALLNIERGGTKVSSSSSMIIKIFFIMLFLQVIFAFILSGIFCCVPFYQQESLDYFLSTNTNWTEINFYLGNKLVTIQNDGSFYSSQSHSLLSLTFDNLDKVYIPTYQNYGLSLWYALFSTGSAINNAGFDLFGSSSLQFLRNDQGIYVQVIILILIFIGGIGFPVLYDLSNQIEWYWKHKILYQLFHKIEYARLTKPQISGFTKLCLFSALIVGILSVAIVFLTEYVGSNNYVGLESKGSSISETNGIVQNSVSIINYPNTVNITFGNTTQTLNFWGNDVSLNKNFSIIFNALSARSAGFSTVNFQNMTEASILVIAILMFIGTSPSSTGGGIRTTTLFVMFKSMFSWFRGVENTSMFKRKIPIKTIKNSFIVFLSALTLILVLTVIMYITSSQTIYGENLVLDEFNNSHTRMNFISFLFEACSAFGTSGNSYGITGSAYIQSWNLIILMILMFIGQMGMSSANLLFARKVPKKQESNYLEEDIRLG